jgi:hypothetical protein
MSAKPTYSIFFSQKYFETQLTKTVTTALLLYRSLVGGAPFEYIGITLKAKTRTEEDVISNAPLQSTGAFNVGVILKAISDPGGESLSPKTRTIRKRAIAYASCISKVLKLVLFISKTVKEPEERFLEGPMLRSMRVLYDAFSADSMLSEDLGKVCPTYADETTSNTTRVNMFRMLSANPKAPITFHTGTPEQMARELILLDSVLSRLKGLCEVELPPLREFGVAASASASVSSSGLDVLSLKTMFSNFQKAFAERPLTYWRSIYSDADIFNPYNLVNPSVQRDTFLPGAFLHTTSNPQSSSSRESFFGEETKIDPARQLSDDDEYDVKKMGPSLASVKREGNDDDDDDYSL